jgi:hypothetical protein
MTPERAKELLPIIQAFAAGKTVQYRHQDSFDSEWRTVDNPTWSNGHIYRIKPETRKFRVCLLRDPIRARAWLVNSTDLDVNKVESYPNFIRWLTDWVEYEIHDSTT